MRKKAGALLAVVLLCFSIFGAQSASFVPYTSYTYSYTGEPKESPDMYIPSQIVTGEMLGTDSFEQPSDVYVDQKQQVHISDTNNHRVVITNKDWTVRTILSTFYNAQTKQEDALKNPSGTFVDEQGQVYVADTENKRIVVFNAAYEFVRVIGEPDASVLPEGFLYKPYAVAADGAGRIYVVAKSTNMGIVVMNPDGSFVGFYGAQKVVPDFGDLFWQAFMTKEQKKRVDKFVPTEYNNLRMEDGFLYVTTSAVDQQALYAAITARSKTGEYTPIKKLNPTGTDILVRNGFFPPVGDVKATFDATPNSGLSAIIDVAVTQYGVYTLLDAKKNKLFTYDSSGNLLNAFGGTGEQMGLFRNAISIVYKDSQLVALDTASGRITVFDRTAYGDQIYKAIGLYKDRQYAQANQQWNVILEQNGNLDLAYIGVGKSLMMSEQYQEAMGYFRKANDVSNYSKAYKQQRDQTIRQYIFWLLLAVAILLVLWRLGAIYVKKTNQKNACRTNGFTVKDELLYALYVIFHPFDGFWEMKRYKRASWKGAGILLGILCAVMMLKTAATGYVFNSSMQEGSYNFTGDLVLVLLPFALWCVANWCFTSLLEGEGSFSNIVVTTSYSLTPLILMMIPAILCSNFLALEEQVVYQFLIGAGILWSAFLLFIGMLVIHDYTLSKNVMMVVLTIVGMLVILFLGVLFVNLAQRMYWFFAGIVQEITFRL